jgi:succinate dehydrogenase/fumarate reductase flavoprotein subunit
LQNLLTIARLMIDAALRRDESRGTHFRSDFPARDDTRWGLRHVVAPPPEPPGSPNPTGVLRRLDRIAPIVPNRTEEEF